MVHARRRERIEVGERLTSTCEEIQSLEGRQVGDLAKLRLDLMEVILQGASMLAHAILCSRVRATCVSEISQNDICRTRGMVHVGRVPMYVER